MLSHGYKISKVLKYKKKLKLICFKIDLRTLTSTVKF